MTVRGQGYRLNPAVQVIEAVSETGSGTSAPQRSPSRNWRFWTAPLALVLVLLTFASARMLEAPRATMGRPFRVTNSREAKQSPLVTDGRFVYFTKTESGKYSAARKLIDGEREETLPLAVPNPYVTAISPDGGRLLVRSVAGEFDDLGPFFVVSVGNWSANRLGANTGFDGQWSPSGKEIAISHDHDLLIVANDGRLLRTAATVPGMVWWPRWSPDGQRIRFTENAAESQTRSIMEVSLTDTSAKPVFPDNKDVQNACCGAWNADGKSYVFQTTTGGEYKLWANLDGGWLNRRKAGPVSIAEGYRGPVFSPNGKTLFARRNIPSVEAVAVNSIRGDAHVLYPEENGFLALSPEKRWLAISTIPDDRLMLRDLQTGQEREIVKSPAHAVLPRWSPDGAKLAFARRLPQGLWRICILSIASGEVKEAFAGGPNQIDPSWFPDGKRIAFGGIPTIDEQNPLATQIRLINLEDGSLISIAAREKVYQPNISPDSNYLVALASPSQHPLLYDFAKHSWRELANEPVMYPAWSADGRFVYCGMQSEVVQIRIDNLSRSVVFDLSKIGPPSTYGRWLERQPDGSLVVFRDISVNDFYGFAWNRSP